MESLVIGASMINDTAAGFWQGKRVLVTGQTGFKGAWLCLWLEKLGAKVSAFALPSITTPNLHGLLSPWTNQVHATIDLRDASDVASFIRDSDPEIIFHLAAQALVRRGYLDPIETIAANVMGTVHVVNAARELRHLKALVIATTDKVYANDGSGRAFVESDRLGGKDPYSSSKACAELLTQSMRDSYFQQGAKVATVRAGNVVGGGDWSEDRLVPDLVRAMLAGKPLELRFPNATRPWQHVLEPLWGYMLLAQRLVEAPVGVPLALNFGPNTESVLTVADVAETMSKSLEMKHGWVRPPGDHPTEAPALALDSSLATRTLGWTPRLTMDQTIDWTSQWYRRWHAGEDVRAVTIEQIDRYQHLQRNNSNDRANVSTEMPILHK